MRTIIYPAVFHREEDGRYYVTFPDLEGCITGGDTLEDAFNMAGDALYSWFDAAGELYEQPKPSPFREVKAENGAIVLLVKAVPCDYTS